MLPSNKMVAFWLCIPYLLLAPETGKVVSIRTIHMLLLITLRRRRRERGAKRGGRRKEKEKKEEEKRK